MEQQLVWYLNLLHTTMPILPLPRGQWMIMIYELMGWVIQDKGVLVITPPSKGLPYSNWSLWCNILSPNSIFHLHILHKFQFGIKMARSGNNPQKYQRCGPSQYHSRIRHRIGKMQIKTRNKQRVNKYCWQSCQQ